jgi:hypothetical protein
MKGFVRKLPGVIKLAPPEVIAAQKQPVPSGQLEAVPQSFAGVPPPPTGERQKQRLAASQANPLLKPSIQRPPKQPANSGASLPPPPQGAKRPLRFVKETSDFKRRQHTVTPQLQNYIDLDRNPRLKGYQEAQSSIETNNPYLTDTQIYTPQTRRSFYRFVSDNYDDAFKLLPQIKGHVDEEACSKLGAAAGQTVEAFLYQKFIREYIRNASPYRGILVYHGLGSGKTCSAIAAAEALYGTANKKIIVMTPYSLRGNFMSEISFCGFRHFHTQNHWVAEPLVSEEGLTYLYARSVLSLTDSYLTKVLRRPEEERKVIWVPDFTQPPDYDSLSQQEREDIRAQITDTIESRITFISYNGVTATKLKKYACEADPVTGERLFDNAVIVIDEIHNLTRLMQGEITQYITERKGKQRKIPAEPIVPGKWQPKLCDVPLNYKRAYLFYKLLTDARNSKIIGLSGTPIINFPDEVGILANVLAGYTECAEFLLNSPDKAVMERARVILEAEPRVDIVRFKQEQQRYRVLVSTFHEGYVKALEEENQDHPNQVGVKYSAEAQEGIRDLFPRIKEKLAAATIPISQETYVSYPRLPTDPDEFKKEFINSVNLSIQNKIVLQKRLTGLISYYKGSKEEYMPRVIRDEIVRCEMSDFSLDAYVRERVGEIRGEMEKKEGGDAYSDVEMFAKMKNPSSYRFRSRALCNFVFPKGIERPFPGSKEEQEMEVVEVEDTQMTEMDSIPNEDLAKQEEVAMEDKQIEAQGIFEGEGQKEEAIDQERVELAAVQEAVDEEKKEEQVGGDYEEEEEEEEQEEQEEQESNSSEEDVNMKGGVGEEAAAAAAPAPAPAPAPAAAAQKPKRKFAIQMELAPVASAVSSAVSSAASAAASAVSAVIAPAPVSAPASVSAPAPPKSASVARVVSYQKRLVDAMSKLDQEKANFLRLDSIAPEGALRQYSAKLDHMLRRIDISKGSNLVYSQFKTVEGLGVLALALRANGYVELKVEGSEQFPYFSKEAEESLRKGPRAKEKRFITFTGEGSRDRRNLVLNIFNGNFDKLPNNMRRILEESGYTEQKNKYGDICWVIGITGAGAEGISLKCCRSVHIMEPYWNNVRLDQVKGRAIRICSHQELPFKEREVEIYTYYSVFSADQKNSNKIDMTIMTNDDGETSDEKVYNVSMKKDKINQEILNLMKEAAVDCGLNAADNGNVRCFMMDGRPDQYMFDPDLQVDKLITSSQLVEEEQVKADVMRPQEVVAKELGERAMPKANMIQVRVIKYKGVEYLLQPKEGTGSLTFEMFDMRDDRFRRPLGEITVNPLTGSFKGSKVVMKT